MSIQPTSKRHRRLGSMDKKEDGLPVNLSVDKNALQVGARKAYDRLRSVGMPATVTFEAFFSIYSLGSGGGNVDMGRKYEYEDVERKEKRKNNPSHGLGHWGKDGNSSVAGGKQLANSKDLKSNWGVHPRVAGKHPAETLPNADRHQGKVKWQEAFDIVSERLIGRAEVARVRANILAFRERSAMEDPMKEAEEEQERLYRSLASVKKEWELESKSVAALHDRERNVRREIENQKRVLLLLSVLENKAMAKMRRIGGLVSNSKATEVAPGHDGVSIADLVKALRLRVASTSEKFRDELDRLGRLQPSRPSFIHVACQLRRLERFPDSSYRHTHNALANLHNYHTKLPRSKHTVNGDLHGRLEKVLKALGVLDIVETKRKLVAVARLRAERKRRSNQMKWLAWSNAQVDLDDKLTRNERKAMHFQNSLKKAVALGWVCEGYIDMISTFCDDTATELVDALEAECKRVEGHVDKTKAIILQPRLDAESEFVQDVRKIMGTTRIKVWEDVEESLKSLKRSSLLTNAFQPPLSGPPKLTEQDPVKMDVSRVTELFERKLQKSKHGYAIAQEIRALLDGQKKLKYI